jgi:hypothetical protein
MARVREPFLFLFFCAALSACPGCSSIIDTEKFTYGAGEAPFPSDPANTDTGTEQPGDTGASSETAVDTVSTGVRATDTDPGDFAPLSPTDSETEGATSSVSDCRDTALCPEKDTGSETGQKEPTDTDRSSATARATDTETPTAGAADAGSEASRPTDTTQGTGPSCEGWIDKDHNLCWEEPYDKTPRTFSLAETYCATKGETWRVPKLSELRMLVRGCAPSEYKVSYTLDEDCLLNDDADWRETTENCGGCTLGNGPSQGGCYWDETISEDVDCFDFGEGETREFWSSIRIPENNSTDYSVWTVDYSNANVSYRGDRSGAFIHVRCVKTLEQSPAMLNLPPADRFHQ